MPIQAFYGFRCVYTLIDFVKKSTADPLKMLYLPQR